MKKTLVILLLLTCVLLIFFVGKEKPLPVPQTIPGTQYEKAPSMTIHTDKEYSALIHTSKGNLKINLLTKKAPNTVNNFIFLAKEGFYTNRHFFRIMKNFLIEADALDTGRGGPGYKLENENNERPFKRGMVAMGNLGYNTGGSKFFIVHQDFDWPNLYSVFGYIDPTDVASFTTLDAIANTEVDLNMDGESAWPVEAVVIESITIIEK